MGQADLGSAHEQLYTSGLMSSVGWEQGHWAATERGGQRPITLSEPQFSQD